MKIEMMFEVRKRTLKRLVDKAGSTAEFARIHKLDENRVRHLLNGVRNFGEKAARQMEEVCGLPDFYFDMDASEAIALVSLFSRLDDRDKEEMRRTAEILERQKRQGSA